RLDAPPRCTVDEKRERHERDRREHESLFIDATRQRPRDRNAEHDEENRRCESGLSAEKISLETPRSLQRRTARRLEPMLDLIDERDPIMVRGSVQHGQKDNRWDDTRDVGARR